MLYRWIVHCVMYGFKNILSLICQHTLHTHVPCLVFGVITSFKGVPHNISYDDS